MPVEAAPGDSVLSGGVNGSAKLTLRVTSAFEDSTASRILRMIEESSARKGKAEKLITRFARVYTPIVLVLAILVAVLPPLFGLGAFSVWLYRALTMLVASCPCALVISVPLGFFAGIGVESTNGMLIKGGKYLEALAKADTVVLDKTGTITTGALSVSSVWTAEGVSEQMRSPRTRSPRRSVRRTAMRPRRRTSARSRAAASRRSWRAESCLPGVARF